MPNAELIRFLENAVSDKVVKLARLVQVDLPAARATHNSEQIEDVLMRIVDESDLIATAAETMATAIGGSAPPDNVRFIGEQSTRNKPTNR